MKIRSISIQNLRVHKKTRVDFSDDITYIHGKNGTGKTTILESINYVLQGGSFKSTDGEILAAGADWFRIDAKFDDHKKDTTIKYDGKKTIKIDGKNFQRMSKNNRYPVVLFEPDVLNVISGPPSKRRDYMDKILATIDDNYHRNLRNYERCVAQRNILLKQRANQDALFAWNIALSEYGSYIVASRQKLADFINSSVNDYYRQIAKKDDQIKVEYSYQNTENIANQLLRDIEQNTEKDFLLGVTTVGPHRQDLNISFNSKPAAEVASRGEARTIILALKFIEVDIIEQVIDKKPIVLLDDVLGELDSIRQKQLIKGLSDNQIIITTTMKIPGRKKDNVKIVEL